MSTGQQRICQTTDAWWNDCIGEKKYSGPGLIDGTFSGKWKDNRPADAHGTIYLSRDGKKDGRYVGEFNEGAPNGQGAEYNDDGTLEYHGEWKDGRWHGQGSALYDDGSVAYKGWWCNGLQSDGPCHD